MSKNTEVTVVQEFQLPALSSEMSTAMAEEMDGLQLTFDRVKIPSGGGITFEIDNGTDQPDAEKEIIGVIVDHHPVNAYWAQSFTGGSNPPDCASMDGKYGVGSPGGSCKTCTLNQYGSAFDGRGKACKNMHRIFIMRSGETLPLLLALPPTSLRGLSDYIAKRIITRGLRSYGVVTRIGLKKAQNAGGIAYSQATFSLVSPLPEDQVVAMASFSEAIKATTRRVEIEMDEDYSPGPSLADDEAPF
jgi:hypothetical protein